MSVIKINVWVSILAAASAVGLLAYAVSRRTSPAQHVRSPLLPELGNAVPVRIVAAIGEDSAPTVELLRKAPPLLGADDAEALDADDLGRDWLARAAQSEPSRSEFDLDIVLDEIADPTAEADITESLEVVEAAEV